ncbi:hypothetical protein KL867_05885 [Ruegeria litorea]|uniref:Uncharacterized protein n=1 Tax=Falsiruegeria litorea TaxID=1280831 RepID=A0ABS5WN61_9RHOB|nr:hypothetical protein [Falsiruegeria litorea]MBT3140570.1 hypothetical protein [Falsiruegeria litorea]
MNTQPAFRFTTDPIRVDYQNGDHSENLRISHLAISGDGTIGLSGTISGTSDRTVAFLSADGTILQENRRTQEDDEDSVSGPRGITNYVGDSFLYTTYSQGRYQSSEGSFTPSYHIRQALRNDSGSPTDPISYSAYNAGVPGQIEAYSDGRFLYQLKNGSSETIVRHLDNGLLDTEFQRPYLNRESIRDFEPLDDGSVLVVLEGSNRLSLVKLTNTGAKDFGFGIEGRVNITTQAFEQSAYTVNVGGDGKIYLAGEADGDFVLVRLLDSGLLDTTFGPDGSGFVITPVGTIGDSARTVLIQDDGKIVVVGNRYDPNVGGLDAAVVRYNTDGTLDTGFGDAGKTIVRGSGGDSAQLQEGGSIVVAGGTGIFRLTKHGHFDNSFSNEESLGNSVDLNGDVPVILANDAAIFDEELSLLNDKAGNFSGASLTIEGLDGRDARDEFSFKITRSSTFDVTDSLLKQGGKVFAIFENAGGHLKIDFTGTGGVVPTTALITEVMRSISYVNRADSRPETVFINWIFSDGNAGGQGNGGALQISGVTTVSIQGGNVENLITENHNFRSIDEDYYVSELVVGTFVASDVYQRNIEYSVSDDRFRVRATSDAEIFELVLRPGSNLDYENSYTSNLSKTGIQIVANRAGSPEDILSQQSFVLTINDVESEDIDASSSTSRINLLSRDDEGPARLIGGSGRDNLSALNTNGTIGNVLIGNVSPDRLTTTGGNDTLSGGRGNDSLFVYLENTLPGFYDGGEDHDTLFLHSASTSVVDLRSHDIRNIETLTIRAGHIAISGQQFLDLGPDLKISLNGESSYDRTLEIRLEDLNYLDLSNALEKNSYLRRADDGLIRVIAGDQPTDIIGSQASEYMLGGLGNDTFQPGISDTVDGGLGVDTASYVSSSQGLNFNVRTFNHPEPGSLREKLSSVEILIGTNFDDTIVGDLSDVREYYGGMGADSIFGSIHNDLISGGGGNDTLRGFEGDDTLLGGEGDDLAIISASHYNLEVFNTSGGILISGDSSTRIGNDAIRSDIEAIRFLTNTMTYAEIAAMAKDKTVSGTNASENVNGTAASELINAYAGSDWIMPGGGNDTVDGGDGNDMVSFIDLSDTPGRTSTQFRFSVDLGAGTALNHESSEQVTLSNVERVTGTIYADYIRGDDSANQLRGAGDYDWFIATTGNDTLDGGTGQDMVSFVEWTNSAEITISDAFSTDGAPPTGAQATGVLVDLADPSNNSNLASGLTMTSIERVTGSGRQDVFYGNGQQNDFRGLGDYDWFVGSSGGRERYFGGDGVDTVTYFQSAAAVTASLRNGARVAGQETGYGTEGDAAQDLYFEIENLVGTQFSDQLTGNDARNQLAGLDGDDFLFGFGGVDYLKGGEGDDTIDGGAGSDYALFFGNLADYTLTRSSRTQVQVTGNDGVDELVNVEYFRFGDETIRIWDLVIT